YTAGALSSLCFRRLRPAIDGNTRRVLSRITNRNAGIEDSFITNGTGVDSRDYVQALMELGERICLPTPDCAICPVEKHCAAFKAGTALQLPKRAEKKKPIRYYWYLLLLRNGEAFYMLQNGKREFLKDSWIFPDLLSEKKLTNAQLVQHYRQHGISI